MARKRHTAEEIVLKLRQVDVLMAQSRPVAEAVRAIAVTEVTYWAGKRPTRSTSTTLVMSLSHSPLPNALRRLRSWS